MPKRAVFERSRRERSLDVSVGVHILLVAEQSSLESRSRGCAKTPILTSTLKTYVPPFLLKLWLLIGVPEKWGATFPPKL